MMILANGKSKTRMKIHPDLQEKIMSNGLEYWLMELNELIEVNPRYKNAAPLLKQVKKKLNQN